LPPIVLPDLSAIASPVQEQIRAQYSTLTSALADQNLTASDRARRYADLGNYLRAAAFFDEAAACYAHAEALAPTDPQWPYLRGHALLRKGDRAGAASAFERTTVLRADYAPALVWLGDVYLDLGRIDQARGAFARALTANPDFAAALFGAGRTALARGAYDEAVDYMEHARRIDPRASSINYSLAMAYRGARQRDKAEQLLRDRGTIAPSMDDPLLQSSEVVLASAVSFETLGMDALRRQDWNGAIEAFRHGLEIAPGDSSLRYWMATSMAAAGDAAGAERELQAVVRANPDFANAHFSLGAMLERRGQRMLALREYEAAVTAAPTMAEARLRLADTLRAEGRMKPAMVHYEEAVTLDPGLADAWIGGAQALIAGGQKEAAREWLARARQIHPSRRELAELAERTR
jgi:tetratricopeptide (TPR) repeat protein